MTTIKDVARIADVAPSTVSNALAGKPCVKPKTCERIKKIAAELHYTPNIIAASMVTKNTDIIGIFFYNFTKVNYATYFDFISGVTQESGKKNMRVMLYADISQSQLHRRIISNREPIDGAIVFCPQEDDYRISELAEVEIPMIMVGKIADECTSYCDVNNVEITYNVVKNLLGLGHRKILLFNSKKNWLITHDRWEGYGKAFREYGLEPDDALHINTRIDAALDKANFLSIPESAYTAVVTESADIAELVYEREASKGRRVGEFVSLAMLGIDDRFKFLKPKLTSVTVDYKDLGSIAVRQLNLIPREKSRQKKEIVIGNYKIEFTESCSVNAGR
ncbi:MAG: LacI family transcriptional regulator [Clostridiales bacterium]|jgi:DNA-binding LacI/PurR family transcriptional regulator|nr:LacI family transcriptional regulator [Clostridiales bacterium]